MVQCARNLKIPAKTVRSYMEENFSVERMARDYLGLYSRLASREVEPSDEKQNLVA